MLKIFCKFCFISFLFLFSINISSAFILPPNGCSISSASHTFYAMTATGANPNSLDGIIPLCVVDTDSGQTVTIVADGVSLPSIQSGSEQRFNYPKVFNVNDIGKTSLPVKFLVSDGVASLVSATYNITILPQPIISGVTVEGVVKQLVGLGQTGVAGARSGETVVVNCSSCTYIKIYKNNILTTTIPDNANHDLTFTFSKLFTDTNTSYVLADTNYKIEYGNIATTHVMTLSVAAKPITVTAINQSGEVGKDSTLTWNSDGNRCEVKWTDGSSYFSFSPAKFGISNPIPTVDRIITSWSTVVPTKNLSGGLYGYKIICDDTQYLNRVANEAIILLTLTADAIAQLYLDTDPNYLSWKCLNASQSSLDNIAFNNTLTGKLKHNDTTHNLQCKNLPGTSNPNFISTATYYPSSLTLTQPATTTVSINYTCHTLSTRVILLKDSSQLPVTNVNGNYTDTNVIQDQTYTYKLSCFKNQNNLLAYSQKTIKVGTGLIASPNPDPDPVSCSYQAGSVNCINIPICSSNPTVYATQFNMTTSGSANPTSSNTGSNSSYFYTGNNSNIYQYNFLCPTNPPKIINPFDDTTYDTNPDKIKILKAVVPPYSHFLNFNVSSASVQAGGTVNLNWNIQSPTSTCKIIPNYIKSTESLNSELQNFIDQQTLPQFAGSELSLKIKGQGAVGTITKSVNGSQKLTIDKSTRFTAECTENRFAGTILFGDHKIIRDVYVTKELER